MKQFLIAVAGGLLCLVFITIHTAHAHDFDDYKIFKQRQHGKTIVMEAMCADSLCYTWHETEAAPERSFTKLPNQVTHGYYAYQRHVREKPRICMSRGTAVLIS